MNRSSIVWILVQLYLFIIFLLVVFAQQWVIAWFVLITLMLNSNAFGEDNE